MSIASYAFYIVYCSLAERQYVGLSIRWDFIQLCGVGRNYSCYTRIVRQLERAYTFSILEKRNGVCLFNQKKKSKGSIGSRMASYYWWMWVMPQEGREPHRAITKKVTCAILRDWKSKKTTFEEKSVEYTEIWQKISHMKSRMRESRKSGFCEGRTTVRGASTRPLKDK